MFFYLMVGCFWLTWEFLVFIFFLEHLVKIYVEPPLKPLISNSRIYIIFSSIYFSFLFSFFSSCITLWFFFSSSFPFVFFIFLFVVFLLFFIYIFVFYFILFFLLFIILCFQSFCLRSIHWIFYVLFVNVHSVLMWCSCSVNAVSYFYIYIYIYDVCVIYMWCSRLLFAMF
jgi:hypothetical protein